MQDKPAARYIWVSDTCCTANNSRGPRRKTRPLNPRLLARSTREMRNLGKRHHFPLPAFLLTHYTQGRQPFSLHNVGSSNWPITYGLSVYIIYYSIRKCTENAAILLLMIVIAAALMVYPAYSLVHSTRLYNSGLILCCTVYTRALYCICFSRV